MTKESKRAPDDPGFDRILRAAGRQAFCTTLSVLVAHPQGRA
jgi:hypothetical protein